MQEIVFKPGFIERYSELTDFETFKKASLELLERSARINTLKISPKELIERMKKEWEFKQVPWFKDGYFMENKKGRRDIGNTLESALGYIYVQEASSMIPPVVLDPKPGEVVLDIAASPGSKTTQMAAMMRNKGIIVANDIKPDRMKSLVMNLQKCGVQNVVTTMQEGRKFSGYQFDKVLVDAPCSGTGTIKKSLKTINIWNPSMIKRLSFIQKKLLITGFENLKPGGVLVYSTCSVEPEENEGVVSWLLEKKDDAKIDEVDVNLKKSKPIEEFGGENYNPEVKKTLRIWPQDNNTCGFYIAKVRKLN